MGIPIIGDIIGAADGILGKFIGNKEDRDKAKFELEKQLMGLHSLQAMANVEQAKHGSIFVAGARPFVMWVCGFALAYKFILSPFLEFGLVVFVPDFPIDQLPVVETSELTTVLLGMLGLGGMRTYEKIKDKHTIGTKG